MRQRNDTGYPRSVSAWPTDDHPDLEPFDVGVGELVDYPKLLAGFTSLEPPPPEPPAEPEPAADAPAETVTVPKARKTAAQPASTGGDSA